MTLIFKPCYYSLTVHAVIGTNNWSCSDNGRFGGYGVYRTTQRSYETMTCTKHAGGQLTDDHYNQDIYSHRIHNHISSRCSIDFYEAHAIRAGLRDLLLDIRDLADTGHNGAMHLFTATQRDDRMSLLI